MTEIRVACIGEAMVELSLDVSGESALIGFAGDTLNTAIYLKRALGPRHPVAFVTMLGQDDFSGRMLDFISGEDVETDRIARHPTRAPGLYAISTDENGERSFTYWRGQSAAREMFSRQGGLPLSALDDVHLIYFSAITLAILPPEDRERLLAHVADHRRRGGLFAFDSNYRPRLWESVDAARNWVGRAWSICDIALPSVDDEMALFGDTSEEAVLKRLRAAGNAKGALKRGKFGPLPITGEQNQTFPPSSHVVDTTAAGDSFNGGYLGALLQGETEVTAMHQGHVYATRVIGAKGAVIAKENWQFV